MMENPAFTPQAGEQALRTYLMLQSLRFREFLITTPLNNRGFFYYKTGNIIQNSESTLLDEVPKDGSILFVTQNRVSKRYYFNPDVNAQPAFSLTPPKPDDFRALSQLMELLLRLE